MRNKLIVVFLFFFGYSVFLFFPKPVTFSKAENTEVSENKDTESSNSLIKFKAFDDKYAPPAWWNANDANNPIFELSQNYSTTKPSEECPSEECTWNKISFKTKPKEYLQEVLKYAFKGNLEADWDQRKKMGQKWYHAPYMHLDIVNPLNKEVKERVGREFIHGLTMERPTCVSELTIATPCLNPTIQNWAISLYNERGSFYISKVWEEMMMSNPKPEKFPKKGFPDGTVALKLLFTQATPAQVPYLKGSKVWWADIYRSKASGFKEDACKKSPQSCFAEMRLLQIDIAVRDDRKDPKEQSPIGWVFATFTYKDGAKPFFNYSSSLEKDKKNPWLRIEQVGLMFGNDPNVPKGNAISESILNKQLSIPQHYGCGDNINPQNRRLNGPVDNPASSCIACHTQSETPKNLNIGDVLYAQMKCENQMDINFWFKNINPRSENPTFTTNYISLDYSLQLREGIRRYCDESFISGVDKCKLKYKPDQKLKTLTSNGFILLN